MHYNADDYLDSQQEPTYTHHGCTYYGRVLSFDQWVVLTRHLDVLSAMLRKYATMDELSAAKGYVQFRMSMHRIIDAIFPARCRVTTKDDAVIPTRGWLITRPARVSDLIQELPLEAQCEAVRRFTRSQARRQTASNAGETTTSPPTPTSMTEPPLTTGSEATQEAMTTA